MPSTIFTHETLAFFTISTEIATIAVRRINSQLHPLLVLQCATVLTHTDLGLSKRNVWYPKSGRRTVAEWSDPAITLPGASQSVAKANAGQII